jgi:hypothetical protein
MRKKDLARLGSAPLREWLLSGRPRSPARRVWRDKGVTWPLIWGPNVHFDDHSGLPHCNQTGDLLYGEPLYNAAHPWPRRPFP